MHYFVVLVKYKARVIATQMLCTIDGVQRDRLAFPNLINLRDLDFDFQVLHSHAMGGYGPNIY